MSCNLRNDGERRVLPPRSTRKTPLLDDPPMGHLQAIVLKSIAELGNEACGATVQKLLEVELGVRIDHSQIYASISKLNRRRPVPYVMVAGIQPSPVQGPPRQILVVTEAGRAAIAETAQHHDAVQSFLKR